MTLVADASLVAAALLDDGAVGAWARGLLASDSVVAPHVMPAEVASVLRRSVFRGDVSSDVGALALADLLDIRAALAPFRPFARRIWELRDTVTPYDAWYVAIAESLGSDLATLDSRLAMSPGPRCRFLTPP